MSASPADADPPQSVAEADPEVVKAREKVDVAAQPENTSLEAALEAAAPGGEAACNDSAALLSLHANSNQEQRRLAVADWSPSDCQADTRSWVDQDHEDDEHVEDRTIAAEPANGVSHREEQAQACLSDMPRGHHAAQAGTHSEVHVASSIGAGETTESDSEVDAAEVFVDAQGRRGNERFTNGLLKQALKPAKRKRQSSEQVGAKPKGTATEAPKRPCWPVPSGGKQSPERAGAKSPRGRNSPGASTAEALQNIQRTGSAELLPVITTGMPGMSSQPASTQSPIVSTAMNKLPGALQALAQLIQAQQLLATRGAPALQLSPFQNQPISPPKAPSASGPLMRNCFSETSADTLTAGVNGKAALALQPNGSGPLPAIQENSRQSSQAQVSLMTLLQTLNSSSSHGGSEHVYPAAAHSAPPAVCAGSGPLPVPSPFGPTARASDSRHLDAKAMKGLLSKLGMPSGFLLPRKGSEADTRDAKDLEALAARAQSLSSFGSLISSAMEAVRTQPAAVASQGSGAPHLPSSSPAPPKPQASNGLSTIVARSNCPNGSLHKTAAAFKSEAPPDGSPPPMPWLRSLGGTSASSFAPFGDRAVPSTAKTHTSAAMPPATTVPQPDPRILEWVLGARTQPSPAAAGLPTSKSAAKHAHSADLDKLFPRGNSAEGAGILGSGAAAKGLATQSSTLRRPIAIRPASVHKEGFTLPNRSRSEGILDSIALPGLAAAALAAEGALPPRSPTSSQTLTELALLAQQTLTSGDLGRVMQWAGRELALRDKKVREAEAAQEEERKAHNAALNAVGAEVSRLKRGQTELAVTHWNLQESLKQKTADQEEKAKLVAQLSRGLAEMTNTGMRAAKDRQRLQVLSEQLANALARRNTQVLEQIKQLEDLLEQGNTEEAKALLISFRRGLDTPQLQEEPAPSAGIPVPQTGPVTSA